MINFAVRPSSLPWFSAIQLVCLTAAAALRERPELIQRALTLVRGY